MFCVNNITIGQYNIADNHQTVLTYFSHVMLIIVTIGQYSIVDIRQAVLTYFCHTNEFLHVVLIITIG